MDLYDEDFLQDCVKISAQDFQFNIENLPGSWDFWLKFLDAIEFQIL